VSTLWLWALVLSALGGLVMTTLKPNPFSLLAYFVTLLVTAPPLGPEPGLARLWVPLFLKHPQTFAAGLARFAGADHELARAFRANQRLAE
jgi:hypothetical protein